MNSTLILQHFLKPAAAQKVALVSAKALRPVTKITTKYGPEILTGVGIAGGVTAAVLGARATLKLETTLDETKDLLATVRSNGELHDASGVPQFPAAAVKRDVARVKIRGALNVAKLYAPSVTLGVASIGCILGAHGIMRQRNVALIGAYNALEKSFAAYRKRVVDEFGEDKDRDFRYGFKDVTQTDPETGKKKTVTEVDPNGHSIYAKFFDEGNVNWQDNSNYNLVFLKSQQQYANNMLTARGHVMLNDVYDSLGLERTSQGAVVGWLLGEGDNYIDFNIYNLEDERKRSFVNGYEKSILLDFNVDGLIWDKIDRKKL